MARAKISVIIPVLNESAVITATLHKAQRASEVEIIVVDGGSTDTTIALAQALGAKILICETTGRAQQMNLGAQQAQGDILLFVHGDTSLPTGYDDMVRAALAQPQVIAGAFSLGIDGSGISFRCVETMVNWRSRFCSLPYGDQALFLKASVFQQLGGFPELPIMEDFAFVQRLRKRGRMAIIPTFVITSSRRWQKLGVWRTTVINQLIIAGYFLGISPQQLVHWYRRHR